MHFEVLVEDQSGGIAIDAILTKLLGPNYSEHSWRLFSYKGIGRIPKGLHGVSNPNKRILLDQLPRLLRGYGQSLTESSVVIVVVDLDNQDCMMFKKELVDILNICEPRPRALFRIAIEECEAWLLGDRNAIKAAYPNARVSFLDGYVQDSVCGTWEVLADSIYSGGATRLKKLGYPEVGRAKCEWAEKIAPYIDVENNQSQSFQVFRDAVRRLASLA